MIEGFNELKAYKIGDKYLGRDGVTRKVINAGSDLHVKCYNCTKKSKSPKCSWRFRFKAGSAETFKVCAVKEV